MRRLWMMGKVSADEFHTLIKIFPESKTQFSLLISSLKSSVPVTVAELSKACSVFTRSEAGIVGSNSTQGMGV
jgi:hypothetical protein